MTDDLRWVRISHVAGRTDEMARICAVLARADERGAALLEALAREHITVEQAEQISGTTAGALDLDGPLPWDFVRQWQPREVLRRAHDVMQRRLAERPRRGLPVLASDSALPLLLDAMPQKRQLP